MYNETISIKPYFFILKRKIIFNFISIAVFILLATLIYMIWNASTNDNLMLPLKEVEMEVSDEPLAFNCCTPLNNSIRTNLFFLKTHKTGSTTILKILLRFGLLNSLDMLNIRYETYFLPLPDFSLFPPFSLNRKCHLSFYHARYSDKWRSYAYSDASMVTILRHPVTLFQSIYKFFQMNVTVGMTFEEFLKAPVKPKVLLANEMGFPAYRGYNQMSVDLGFDLNQSKNMTAIDELVRKIDTEFDLVMITEYMDESLILMANLMGWPLEYLAYVSVNVRPPEPDTYVMTEEDENTVMELNKVDTVLYFHFLEKFKKCIRQYGEEKLKEQVVQLRRINEKFRERCVAEEFVGELLFGKVAIDYKIKNISDLDCVNSLTMSHPVTQFASNVWKIGANFY